ncbi:MAG: hypothetical protein HY291_16455 [Planctomycetes bacterium]|nr:hypothetical protein [Planctomycetota bacterium]
MDLIGGGRGAAIALAAIFLFFIATPVGLGLTQLIFLPLPAARPGKGKPYEPSRAAVLFVAFLFYRWIGLAVVAAYFVWWYMSEARKKALGPPREPPLVQPSPPVSEEPTPRNFSLSDLLAMVLAIACSPLAAALYWGGDLDRNALPVFIMAALIFPVLYFRGMARVNANRVPMGRVRSLFLFFYPYAIFSAMYLCYALILIGGLGLLFSDRPGKPFATPEQLIRLGAAFVTTAAGCTLALAAKAQARAQEPASAASTRE